VTEGTTKGTETTFCKELRKRWGRICNDDFQEFFSQQNYLSFFFFLFGVLKVFYLSVCFGVTVASGCHASKLLKTYKGKAVIVGSH
jgi:hypothetical protein